MIERQVQTIKNTLHKTKLSGADPHMALLILRMIPIDSHLASPAELLNQRKMKSNQPIKVPNVAPNRDATREALKRRQASQKEYLDCQAGPDLRPLQPGQ
uniref:Uncharacterized protein n=1 Tax=Eptatretus burgeri TaxID=7764 RepID=A0A8C4QBG3_EPTBU